jgi:hypothetical protein
VNKKANTVFFMLLMTVLNIVIAVFWIVLLLFVYAKLFSRITPEQIVGLIIPLIFIVALVLTFFCYRALTNLIMKKVNLDDKLEPLFKFGRRKRLD